MSGETRTALVTGSAHGIGRSAAVALAARGYDVVVNYSRSEEAAGETAAAVEAAGTRAVVVRCDVGDDDQVRAMLAACDREFGRLDVLVNNAGTTTSVEPDDLEGLTVEEWDRVFAVNVRGLFLVTRAAVPLLRRAGTACVVNTASIVGLRPGPQPLPYAASKAAIVNLTKTLARVLGPDIRVNAVAPGWVLGDWMQRTLGEHYDRLMERRAAHTPLGRLATPDDVAQTIVSLVESNRFVTGQTIVIDGGYSTST